MPQRKRIVAAPRANGRAAKRARAGPSRGAPRGRAAPRRAAPVEDEEILSEDEAAAERRDDELPGGGGGGSGDEALGDDGDESAAARDAAAEAEEKERLETVDQRRLRLAKLVLQRVGAAAREEEEEEEEEEAAEEEEEGEGGLGVGGGRRRGAARPGGGGAEDASGEEEDADGEEEEGVDPISRRLRAEALREQGKLAQRVAGKIRAALSLRGPQVPAAAPLQPQRVLRAHRLSVTAVALSADNASAYSSGKEGDLVGWDVEAGNRTVVFAAETRAPASQGGGHAGDALSVAVSADGRLLASGGRDGLVRVWDVRERRQVQSFRRHRGAVTGVVFRRGSSSDLYSISADRTVNVWNLEQMAYVETLFGHAAEVLSADALGAQRLITSGADCSVRIWKIPEQTQLLYKGHSASIDAVAFVSDDAFVTGSQDGAVALWSARKKKPMDLVANAHGGKWICSVAAARYGDVAASGASDGALRLWVLEKGGALAPLSSVELAGFVNGMVFSSDSRFLVAAVGQEHRLGRWSRVAEARNSVCIVRLHDAAAE